MCYFLDSCHKRGNRYLAIKKKVSSSKVHCRYVKCILFLDENTEDDDAEPSSPSSSSNLAQKATNPSWYSIPFDASARATPAASSELPTSESISAPSEYFKRFFDETIMNYIVAQSNLYAVQQNLSKPLGPTKKELAKFIAVILKMSLMPLFRSRLYWSAAYGIEQVSSIMGKVRFEHIKRNIHFNNNSVMPTSEEENFDRLFKIRPLLDHLRSKFKTISIDQKACVDEQIVAFKGRSKLKQYVPSKPHKYGYKVFVLCNLSGIIHNFEVYTGRIAPPQNGPDLGPSSNIVITLSEDVPSNRNHLLYCDNWFTSLQLQLELWKRGIFFLGTVRNNRLRGCKLLTDKELKVKGRGVTMKKNAILVVRFFEL